MDRFVQWLGHGWQPRLAAALGSLKLRITVGAIAALTLGIGLATVMLVRQAERDTLAAHHQRELREAVRTAAILGHRVVELQRSLQATGAMLDAATLADDTALAHFLETKPVLRNQFSRIFVATPDGAIRMDADASVTRHPELNIGDRDYFRRTLAEQRAIISPPLPSRVSGEPVVVLTYPLRKAGGVYGVLGGSLRLSSGDLIDDLIGSLDAEQDALIVVTDATGRILAHPQPERLMQSLASEPRLAGAFAQWVAAGSAVEPAGLGLSETVEVVSAAGVAGPDWMVWRAIPQSELLAPLRAARRDALAWAAGLVALMSLTLLALLWWLLRPLTQLERRAQHLFSGTEDAQAGWPDTGGEIGRLARVLRHVGAEQAQLHAFNTQVLQKLGSVMSAAPVGIAFTRASRFELVSAECCRLLGRSEEQLLGQPTQHIYASNAEFQALGPEVTAAFAAGQPFVGERRMLRADGSIFWARLRGRPVDPNDSAAGTIWTMNDIGEQIAAREQLQWSATHDVLTGLANRRVLDAALQKLFNALPRSLPAALLMIDLDHFKPINDSAGHAAGDAMLQAVAGAITGCVRGTDLVVRLGGDEFAVLLENCGTDASLRIGEQVRVAISAIALPWDGRQLGVGASVGVAVLATDMSSADAWVKAADAACYAVKASGRGAVREAAPWPGLRVVSS